MNLSGPGGEIWNNIIQRHHGPVGENTQLEGGGSEKGVKGFKNPISQPGEEKGITKGK